jgi:hypothetical protein
MHGGADGSGGQPGNRNALKHGRYTQRMLEVRRALRELLRENAELVEQVTARSAREAEAGRVASAASEHEPASARGTDRLVRSA